jgi:hypothetical protein
MLYRPLERCKRFPGHVTVRGGMGIGDALYVQSIARHWTETGQKVQVCSAWDEIFSQIPVKVTPFTRLGVDRVAHYTMRKAIGGTSQFRDCCISAGIKEGIDLRLDWKRTSEPEIPKGKPVVVVALPRSPMGRTDGFGAEVLPDCRVIQRLIDELHGTATIVQVGKGEPLFKFDRIDVDLSNRTSVSQMLDIASMADGFLGYCSFLIPLAESFNKPGIYVWSSKIRKAQAFVRQMTPEKVLHRPNGRAIWDDERVTGVLDGFL